SGLLAIVEKRIPAEVFGKIPGTSGGKSSAPSIAGGIGGVQIKGTDYEFAGEKRYLASISSDPEGASLSFNGVPDSRCTKTPCNVELGEGSVRIIAALEQYDMADTTVSIKQNNQSVRIRMKANFGVLEIKPAYSDGIGKDERWSLNINGKVASSWENRLSPNKYKVELSHRCYEDLSFDVGINRDKREVFDMASYVKLKKGGLVLNAERDGKPVSEVVFVNGVQVGETPFSGSVAVCARVEIGSGREKVDVNLKHNEKVVHTAKSSSYKPAVSAGNGFVAQPPTATQKAEGQKKLNALNSKAISVYRDTRGTIISISDVLFEFGKADLKPELKENLAEVASILKNLLTESTVIVEGHTDNVGKADANKKLSDQRASEVVKYLIGRGVDKKRLKSVGYGATKPIADNSTEAGKAKNRRVELVIKDG
ncbi:MAG: OmpA family protein, partial [Fibromonadales bacterium]|nr:OmpA family protein [Fibromonadales bacterium]